MQARVQAYDTAYPDNRAERDLVISVQRNANGPIFSEVRYEYSIAETFPVGDVIGTPVATDSDGVSRFLCDGVSRQGDFCVMV